MDEAIICHIIRRNALLRHSMEQVACLAYLAFLKEAVDDRGICHHVGGAAQIRHPVKQHVESLICPLCVAKALEEGAEDDLVCLQARLEETGEEGECQIRAARAAAAVHEDAIGEDIWLRHPSSGASGQTAKEGNGQGGAISAGCRRGRAGEGSRKVIQGTLLDTIALPQQFVEQVVCVLPGERARARPLRRGGEGGVGISDA